MGTSPDAAAPEEAAGHTEQKHWIGLEGDIRQLVNRLVHSVVGLHTPRRPEAVKWARQLMESKPPSGWIGGLKAVKQRPDSHKIDVPATVINGTEERLVSPDVAEAVTSRISDVELALIPGRRIPGGHGAARGVQRSGATCGAAPAIGRSWRPRRKDKRPGARPLEGRRAMDMELAEFQDRAEAGRVLADRLAGYARRADVVVLALPRGGVPVGFQVARALGASLDVLSVRKLGVPDQEELAMGAIAGDGTKVLNET